jgi:hypothetical protein
LIKTQEFKSFCELQLLAKPSEDINLKLSQRLVAVR